MKEPHFLVKMLMIGSPEPEPPFDRDIALVVVLAVLFVFWSIYG